MARTVVVTLYEATDTRRNVRCALLVREDRPDVVVSFGEVTTEEVVHRLSAAERHRDLIPWFFAESPVVLFNDLTKVDEFALLLKESTHE